MRKPPAYVKVFEPTDRAIHLTGGLLLLAVLATGAAIYAGARAALPLLHAAFAVGALLVWATHLARFIFGWLDKGSDFPLLARAGDLADGLGDFLHSRKLTARGFRQRLPYTILMVLAPVLGVTGFLAAHPAYTTGYMGPATLLRVAQLHEFLGFMALCALLYHLFHAMLCPAALWWNPALLTGSQPWEYYAALNPDSAALFLSEDDDGVEIAEMAKGPGVEELLNLGNAAAKAGDFGTAAGHFREALEVYPGYPQALFNLGASLFKLGDREGARETLNQYLQQDAFGAASDRARAILAELDGEEGK